MRNILKIIFSLIFSYGYAEDYILEFQANVKIVKEYNISNTQKFRSYELIGSFTDVYGNYGKFDGFVISDIKENKLLKLEGTAEITYSNEEIIYLKAFRKESDFDAGVANAEFIGATDEFKPLIGTKCLQSVRYFKDTIFGLQKCKLSKKSSEILRNNSN